MSTMKLDDDLKVMRVIDRALRRSSAPHTLRATLDFFWHRYVVDRDAAENVAAIFAHRDNPPGEAR